MTMNIFKKAQCLFVFIAGLGVISDGQAAIHLELTQGINAAIPIAIIPFANQANNVPNDTTLTQVISSDLQNSGQFHIVAPTVFSQKPTQVSAIDSAYWQKQGASNMVIGQVRQINSRQYEVSFQLVDLNQLSSSQTNPQAVLLNQAFTANSAGL